MSKITVEIDLATLSERGRAAFQILTEELSGTSKPDAQCETITQLAEKLYSRMTRKTKRNPDLKMKRLLNALLDSKSGKLSLKEIKAATGLEGSSLAGALSSMTRNMKRYNKIAKGAFLVWNESEGTHGAYQLADPGLLAPLISARNKHKD